MGSRPNTQVLCKCGARRVDQQLGLEPTPDLYVERIVSVFRQVRRVLAPHGTCWVNLGDSYMAAQGGRQSSAGLMPTETKQADNAPWNGQRGDTTKVMTTRDVGLKPKDLAGIPWRVAFALQQPYYAGAIRNELDRVWLAAMVDAEGCVYIHKRKVGQANGQGYERKSDSYGSGMEIANTSLAIVERCFEITGRGSVVCQEKDRRQPLYRWTLRTNECRDVLREVYPYLVAKQQQARLAIGCPSSGERAEAAHEALKLLHGGSLSDVDFPAPASMFEPGWYVRSDVIWNKPNPMPESVTDRPTKAHEYVFLLTKQPRYYFDQEAVREQAQWERWGDQTNEKYYAPDGWSRDKDRTAVAHSKRPRSTASWISDQTREELQARAATGRNVRSVWQIATQPYPEAHFATYPEELVRRCVLAGCPVRVCRKCGKPSERIVETEHTNHRPTTYAVDAAGGAISGGTDRNFPDTVRRDLGWSDCGHNDWRPGTVLDPFIGSGTTCKVARDHGRHSIGIDLSADYLNLAARRLQQLSLLT